MDFKIGLLLFTILVCCYGEEGSVNPTDTPKYSYDRSLFYGKHPELFYVVGGRESDHGSHPYAIVITTGPKVRGYLCGGSLISKRSVLTAAHCIDAIYKNGAVDDSVRVIVGTNLWAVGGTEYSVERNVTHPDHDPNLRTNDIGLLITTTNVELGELVQPIPLTYDYIGAGVPSRVAAWGNMKVGGDEVDELREVEVSTIDGKECEEASARAVIELKMGAPPVVGSIQICTLHEPGLGTCNGDSGSAMIRQSDNLQIGIVSWGFPCALGAPDVFARVSAYKEFIVNNIVN